MPLCRQLYLCLDVKIADTDALSAIRQGAKANLRLDQKTQWATL